MAQRVCGSKASNLGNVPNLDSTTFPFLWAIFAYCLFYGLCCVCKHIYNRSSSESYPARIISRIRVLDLFPRLQKSSRRFWLTLAYCLLITLWALCFVNHFYMYSIFTKAHLVATEWTFGQIISVTIWFPFLVELFYIELGKSWCYQLSTMNESSMLTSSCRGNRESVKVQISTWAAGYQEQEQLTIRLE